MKDGVAKRLLGLPLTRRENEVMQLIAQGMDGAKISEQLGISRKTYDTHRHAVNAKLGFSGSNTAALVALHAQKATHQ